MKKVHLVTIMILISITVFSQDSKDWAIPAKTFNTGIFPASLKTNNGENSWFMPLNSGTITKYLSEDGFLLSEEIYQDWDSTHWVNMARSTSKYDINNNNRFEKLDQSWNDNNWVNSGKFTYTYDENNNLIGWLVEIWDESDWVNYRKTTITYDENNNFIIELVENWDSFDWIYLSKRTYSWDENNNLTVMLWKNWYDNNWVNEVLETNYYDDDNFRIEWLRKSWDGSDWVNQADWFFIYDENYNLVEDLHLHWQNSEWKNNSKNLYIYDENNNQVEILTQYWNGSNWNNGQKYTMIYDINNNLIKTLRKDWDGSDWENEQRSTFYYIPIGSEQEEYKNTNLNKSIEDFQSTEDDLVIESGKEDKTLIGIEILIDSVQHTSDGDLEFTLSHSDISVSIIFQAGGDGDNFIGTKLTDNGIDSISNGLAPFAGNYKPENPLSSLLETDPAGTWTLSIYDGVAGNTGTLHAWGLNLIYAPNMGWETEPAESFSFDIYPNPAKNKFEVRSSEFEVGDCKIELFDLNGRKLIEKFIRTKNKTTAIDVNSLQDGMYLVQFQSENQKITQKLIIQK